MQSEKRSGTRKAARRLSVIAMLIMSARSLAAGPESFSCGAAADIMKDDLTRQSVQALLGVADTWIDYTQRSHQIPGIAVGLVIGHELLWAKGYGWADIEAQTEATPESLFRIASISKTFTATAVMRLRDEGKLHLDDPVGKYLPWFDLKRYDPEEHPIRLWHLLTHTAGLPSNSGSSNFSEWFHPDAEGAKQTLAGQSLLSKPGSKYNYSNLGYAILGLVIETVSNMSYQEYVETQLMRPLGMIRSTASPQPGTAGLAQGYHSAIWLNDDGSMRTREEAQRPRASFRVLNVMVPAGGAASSIRELARYASFHLNCLESPGVLSPGSISSMQQVKFRVAERGGVGISWAVEHKADGVVEVYHSGGLPSQTSFLVLYPEEGAASLAFTNAEDGAPERLARGTYALLKAAVRGACGPGQLTATEAAKYLGRFRWAEEERQVWIVPVKGRLAMLSPIGADPAGGLTCLSRKEGDVFTFDGGGNAGEELRFITNEGPVAEYVVGPSSSFRRLGDLPTVRLQSLKQEEGSSQ